MKPKAPATIERALALLERLVVSHERFSQSFEAIVERLRGADPSEHMSQAKASSDKPKPPPSVPSTSVQPTELDRARARRIAQEVGMVKR